MQTIDVLKRARAAVDRRWIQGALHDPKTDGVCAMGACYLAAGIDLGQSPGGENTRRYAARAINRLTAVLEGEREGWDTSLPMFNDSEKTRKEDVLALFDRAIASYVTVSDPAHVYVTVA